MRTTTAIIIAIAIIGSAIIFTNREASPGSATPETNNVKVVDGKQVIDLTARGGYFPRATNAKADMPTTLKVATSGTFDCSLALVIPSIGYRSYLPPNGVTEIELEPQKAGTKLNGLCSMGMYGFTVYFN